MAYEPTEWKSGDVVTSAKLNKIEQGIVGAGVFVISITTDAEESLISDKTFAQILAAYQAGSFIVLIDKTGEYDTENRISSSVAMFSEAYYAENEESYFMFLGGVVIDVDTNGVGHFIYMITNSNEITKTFVAFSEA